MNKNCNELKIQTDKIYCTFGYKCNNDCLVCVVDSLRNPQGDLSTANLIDFFNRINNSPVVLEISGGEPTLRKDFLYLMEYLSRNCRNVTSVLFTNGRMFSNSSFAAKASEYPAEDTLVPIHGETAKLHDLQTQRRGSFNQTVLGIENMCEYKMPVIPKIIVTKLNYQHLPKIVQFIANQFPECRRLGIDTMDILGSALRNQKKVAIPLAESVPTIQKAVDVAVQYGLRINLLFVPFCTIEERYRKYIGPNSSLLMYKDPISERKDVELTRGLIKKCTSSNCIYKSVCPGTWYSYFDVFGTDEINPILR